MNVPLEHIGDFVLLEELGRGGIAAVYRARHERSRREYALKLLTAEAAVRPNVAERFRREAEVLKRVHHPNVVHVEGLMSDGELPYIVMDLVPGHSLAKLIFHEGPFAPRRAAKIARQIAAGLAAMHRAGFVHRDLKPQNVVIGVERGEEHATIIDLGIVKVHGRRHSSEPLTATGLVLGTPAYMAPEQLTASEAWPAADLYALGATLYEMLSGAPPFDAENEGLLLYQRNMCPDPPVLEKSNGLEVLVRWLMERYPRNRPDRAETVIEELDRILARTAAQVPFPSVLAPVWMPKETGLEAALLEALGDNHVHAEESIRAAKTGELSTLCSAWRERFPDSVARARQHMQAGIEWAKRGELERAASEGRAAITLDPFDVQLRKMAQAWETRASLARRRRRRENRLRAEIIRRAVPESF